MVLSLNVILVLKKILNVVKCWPQLTVVSVVFTVGHSHPSPRHGACGLVRCAPLHRSCAAPPAFAMARWPSHSAPRPPTCPPSHPSTSGAVASTGAHSTLSLVKMMSAAAFCAGAALRFGMSIVGGTVEGTRRSLFPRSLTKRNDAPRYRSLLSQEGSQTCPSMGF